ncbi:unnamed protein product, partial [Mesorhabditis spiculigera]
MSRPHHNQAPYGVYGDASDWTHYPVQQFVPNNSRQPQYNAQHQPMQWPPLQQHSGYDQRRPGGFGPQNNADPYGGAPHQHHGQAPWNNLGRQQQHQAPAHHPTNFQLNPNAPSFVPKAQQSSSNTATSSYNLPAQQHQHGMAAAFNPEIHGKDGYNVELLFEDNSAQYIPSSGLQMKLQGCRDKAAVMEVQIGFEQLLGDTTEFESWSWAIQKRMATPEFGIEDKKVATALAIEMAIFAGQGDEETLHPYTFARLVAQLFSENADLIMNCVLPVFQEFHESRNHMEEDKRRNLRRFTAELFSRLTMNEMRIQPLGKALLDQVEERVRLPHNQQSDDDIQHVITILQIAGRHLNTMDPLKPQLNDVMTVLDAFSNGHHKLGEHTRGELKSLINEHTKKNWQGVQPFRHPATMQSSSYVDENGAQISLSDEERAFYDTHVDEPYNGEEEDQEMIRDYELYLKEINDQQLAQEQMAKLSLDKVTTEASAGSSNEQPKPSE